jgi:hypothetical protein
MSDQATRMHAMWNASSPGGTVSNSERLSPLEAMGRHVIPSAAL